jgi:hypothetical protein
MLRSRGGSCSSAKCDFHGEMHFSGQWATWQESKLSVDEASLCAMNSSTLS